MAYLRTKNAVVLAKIESTEGTDASPSASTDAVLVENPKISFKPNLLQTKEVSGSLDSMQPIMGGMNATITFDVYLKGSGAAGTAPEAGKLLKACGFAEVITASAVPASPEACAAGGSTTVAVLGVTASGTAETYRGMPVNFSSTVSGLAFISDYTSGKTATLTDTMSGAIVATSNYQIPINVLYHPASSSIPSLTFYIYMDGVEYQFVGTRGTVKFDVTSGGTGKMSFTFTAMFQAKVDSGVPTAVYDSTRPPVFKGGKMLVNRLAAAVQDINFDTGSTLTSPDNPNSAQGFDAAQITERNITGSINPAETLVATRDIMSDFAAGTLRGIHLRYGTVVGNRVGITIPNAMYTNQTPNDRNGISIVDVPFDAEGTDSGVSVCFY